MKIQIKDLEGNVLFEHEQEHNSIRLTVEEAVKRKVSLRRADLRDADFEGAKFAAGWKIVRDEE